MKFINAVTGMSRKDIKHENADQYTYEAELVNDKIQFNKVLTQDTIADYDMATDIAECLNEPYHENKLEQLQYNDYSEIGDSYAEMVKNKKQVDQRVVDTENYRKYEEWLAAEEAKQAAATTPKGE